MTTLNLQVNASANDVHVGSINNDSGRTVTTGGIVIDSAHVTSSILSPGSHGGNDEYSAGARFTNVTVPQGATITSATFILTAQATYNAGSNTISYLVSAEASNNGPAFSVAQPGDCLRSASAPVGSNARPRTTAVSAAWNQNSVTANTEYSIDVTSVVQEIINRAGWVSGNAINIIVDTNTTTTQGEWQDYYSYDGSTTKAPKLNIVYSTGGLAIPVLINQYRQRRS